VNQLIKKIEKIEGYIISTALLVFVFLLFINVIGRYFFLYSISWADEASRYLNIWAVYIGVSVGIKRGAHIGIPVFVNFINRRRGEGKTTAILTDIISFSFCIFIAYYGCKLSIELFEMKQYSPALGLLMGFVYLAIPIGMLSSSIKYLSKIFNQLRGGGEKK